ncbi:OmpA/MotB family protein [Kordiimonas pumila]|uniref:Flagellar motor protein MotB n=1 Tax=Kordiimonas pumila TaxID=2161677 RepID=A0ABV7D2H0_9PROT|nr:flagellar motor protein MotB [Kordiimonas pumila]
MFRNDQRIATTKQDGAAWMLTFADLLSLLLTFFVLLFSMSSVRFESWKAVVDTMTYEFNPSRPKVVIEEITDVEQIKTRKGKGLNLNYLQVLFERAMVKQAVFEGSRVTRVQGGVVISIPASLLFVRKDTILQPGVEKALKQMAGTFVQIDNHIKVAGHTDSAPIINGRYRSNWELSMVRARIVAGMMSDAGYTEPITVLGYADTGNAETDTIADMAFDERVDIIIVAESREKGLYDLF